MLDFRMEEKVLSDMKKMIAVIWRMNHEQLCRCYQNLQKNGQAVLPGQMGSAFLNILEQISDHPADAQTKIWPELVRDADCLLELIRRQGNQEEAAWLAALQKLEVQSGRPFRTELGRAFILVLKEKLGIDVPEIQQEPCQKIKTGTVTEGSQKDCRFNQAELEKVADWLMHDNQACIVQKRRLYLSAGTFQKAAVTVFACLSVCFMGIWLHGQVQKNQNRWNLQQMKISAAKEAEVFMTEYPQTDAKAAIQTEKRTKTDSPAKNIKKNKKQTKETAPKSSTHTLPEILPQYQEMSAQYPELFGWLQIPETQIDFPVMRTGGDDPEFYLHHDITGAESAEGALFVDTASSSYPQDNNTVVYGHNMKNGHIFGTLKMYGAADFFQQHQEIHFDTLYEAGIYEAVAVLKTRILNENEQGFRYYQFFHYENQAEFQECVDFVEKNQLFETSGALQYGDQILMLSTCEYSQENGRLVVVARKVSGK